MKPPAFGWFLLAYGLVATAALLFAACESAWHHRERQALARAHVTFRADLDSAIARYGKRMPVYGPDGRYLWRLDTAAARVPILADTVRKPRR